MSAAAIQMHGGMAQFASGNFGVGFSNWWHGGANIAASAVMMQMFRFFKSDGMNGAKRAFNSLVDGTAAVGGGTIDAVTWISPDFAPQEASCRR